MSRPNLTPSDIKRTHSLPIGVFSCHRHCYNALKVEDMTEHYFLNNRGEVNSTQMINRYLKTIKAKYGVKVEHLSNHSFRKTFGRKVVESAGEQSEMALIKLSESFNHASPMITRIWDYELRNWRRCIMFWNFNYE